MNTPYEVIASLNGCLQADEPVALVTVIASSGSSPGKPGAMMTVSGQGRICGTVGGGNLEHRLIEEAIGCLAAGQTREIRHTLTPGGGLQMGCGGEIRLFIQVFQPLPQLVIIGAGHIGRELYQLGRHQGFRVLVMDDRQEMLTDEHFPEADRRLALNLAAEVATLPLSPASYVTIATSSHETDRLALEGLIDSPAAYIGVIGSRSKIGTIMRSLREKGIAEEKLAKVYAPMGLNIASVLPREIALSIMSEILLVKNNGSPDHLRTIKMAPLK
jgi:xanthine dehydrogenase accessory factor